MYHSSLKNHKNDKGMFTVISMSTLEKLTLSSRHSVSRYLKTAQADDLLIVERVRSKSSQHRFKITPTQKLLSLSNFKGAKQ
jgi:hypothetical protein